MKYDLDLAKLRLLIEEGFECVDLRHRTLSIWHIKKEQTHIMLTKVQIGMFLGLGGIVDIKNWGPVPVLTLDQISPNIERNV